MCIVLVRDTSRQKPDEPASAQANAVVGQRSFRTYVTRVVSRLSWTIPVHAVQSDLPFALAPGVADPSFPKAGAIVLEAT
jgi:hypothetical protein